MRYEKAERVMDLVLEMQARRQGVTLEDIIEKFAVGRRTAMRMRDAACRLHPEIEEILGEDRRKRWRMRTATPRPLTGLTADDFADLEATVKLLRRENMRARAKTLEGIVTRLRAALDGNTARKIEPDLEALLEAEGLARRPGPRPVINDDLIGTIRLAIKAGRQIYITHRNRQTGRKKGRKVHPYGFLFGNRHYLVARVTEAGGPPVRLFALSAIEQAKMLADTFQRDPGFSLQDYANQAFGVFQEPAHDIVWRFRPTAAAAAEEYVFHPRQSMEQQPDGSLIVRFRAGGLKEMVWHLWTWGSDVEVLEPKELKDLWKQDPRSPLQAAAAETGTKTRS